MRTACEVCGSGNATSVRGAKHIYLDPGTAGEVCGSGNARSVRGATATRISWLGCQGLKM